MSIKDQISSDLKDAMKDRNIDKLAALRAAKSAITLEKTKDRELIITDDVCLQIIGSLVKQRKESAKIFKEQNRLDLAVDEKNQLVYLQKYLPLQMTDSEIRSIVKEVIIQIEAKSISDTGRCISLLIQRLGHKADGSLISRIVKEELG